MENILLDDIAEAYMEIARLIEENEILKDGLKELTAFERISLISRKGSSGIMFHCIEMSSDWSDDGYVHSIEIGDESYEKISKALEVLDNEE